MSALGGFSRREREIMNILYKLGTGTAAEVQARLSGDPSYSTVRAQLRILEEKGLIGHEEDGLRYVFRPIVGRDRAGRSALRVRPTRLRRGLRLGTRIHAEAGGGAGLGHGDTAGRGDG